MTAVQLLPLPSLIPALPIQTALADAAATANMPYVVAAPYRPTSFVGGFATVLGDVVLGSVVVLGLVLTPVLAVQGIAAAASFILATLGWS